MSQVVEKELKVTLTVPLIREKVRSRLSPKDSDNPKYSTRGFYLNVPKTIVENLDLKEHELVELTIKKLK